MSLTGAELIAVAAVVWGLLGASITLALKAPRRDASLYPFIAAAVSFLVAATYGSYFSGSLFVGSLVLGFVLYRDV